MRPLRSVVIGGGLGGHLRGRHGAEATIIEKAVAGGAAHLCDCIPSMAVINDDRQGFIKILSGPATGVIPDSSIVGRHAAELVAIVALTAADGLTVHDIQAREPVRALHAGRGARRRRRVAGPTTCWTASRAGPTRPPPPRRRCLLSRRVRRAPQTPCRPCRRPRCSPFSWPLERRPCHRCPRCRPRPPVLSR